MTPDDGLADLLTGSRPPGVYRWHALTPVPQVRDAAEVAGWRWGHLGGWLAADRRSWLRAVGSALDFPAYYGQNLDALWDCLGDLTGPTLLVWDHWARLARADESSFRSVVEILRDRSQLPGSDAAPPFAVLLWGEGPATGTPSLD